MYTVPLWETAVKRWPRIDPSAGTASRRRGRQGEGSKDPGATVHVRIIAGPPGTMSILGHPRRVAVVEHQRVAVGIGEERHVAYARVEDVAV